MSPGAALIGLEPEKALAAWKRAVEKAHGAMITAKLVKEAVPKQQKPVAKAGEGEPRTASEHYRQT